jgi:ribonuclease HII
LLGIERQLWGRGVRRIAGVDEAGRGPLAGPVMAAAVIIERDFAESEEARLLDGLTDSKQLSEWRREAFLCILQGSSCVEIGVGTANVDEIDSINILRATHRAMFRAVAALPRAPDHILVDGLSVEGFPHPCTALVKGDARSLSIAAASVVAKVLRDRHMDELDAAYPQYGFGQHKGYGSPAHIQALFEYGPCPCHRRSFRPVREAFEILRRQRDLQRQIEELTRRRRHARRTRAAAQGQFWERDPLVWGSV